MQRALLAAVAAVTLSSACDPGPEPQPCEPVCGDQECGYDPVCHELCNGCGDGYVCDPDNACADVDECAQGTGCGPGATCTNEIGGFACACPPTFLPDPTPEAGCKPRFVLEAWNDGGPWYGFRQLRALYTGGAFTGALADGANRDVPFVGALLDLADLDALAAGAEVRVTRLFDQAGLGLDAAQPDFAKAPTLVATTDGRRAMSFRTGQGLTSPSAYEAFDRSAGFTMFMPVAWSGRDNAQQGHLFTVGRAAPEAGDWPFALVEQPTTDGATAGRVQAQVQTTSGEVRVDAEGTVGRAGAFELHEVVFEPGAGLTYVNSGRLVGQAALGGSLVPIASAPDRTVTIGSSGTITRGLDGVAYPPVVFRQVLSAADRATVRAELAGYYGVELPAPAPPTGDELTIVMIPDTQRYAEQTGGLQATIITELMQWIATNKAAWNIQMVTQVGDIVNNTQPIQYERALAWYQILDDAGVPYTVAIGNHDYANVAARDSTLYNTYFTQARYGALPWWNGGFFEAGKTDNLWFTASLGGEPYLFVTLEYQPRAAVVAWASALLTTHADKRAIIVTHDFLTPTGAYSTARAITGGRVGAELHAELFSQHPNVFLVLSGHHVRGSAYRHDRATGANYLFFDPTFLDGVSYPETWGNDGYAQLLVLSPSKRTIRVMTYSAHRDTQRTNLKSLFTLDF